MTTDSFTGLDRFVAAQASAYAPALAEIRAGQKRGHWIWFVFPQLRGLGRSETAQLYGIADLAEAKAYLAHPTLSPRLGEATHAVHASGIALPALFGPLDAMKFVSCMTLFEAAAGRDSPYAFAVQALAGGQRDPMTLGMLAGMP